MFSEYRHLPLEGWSADSAIVFYAPIPDTTLSYDVLLLVRHTQQYKYQNMWLFVDEKQTSTAIVTHDTIEFYLADDRGRWLGNGYGNIREMPVLYGQNITFKTDTIMLSVVQAMREQTLHGVSEIGLKIVEHGQE